MKITKTSCQMNVNPSSSFLIYICKTYEDAKVIETMLRTTTCMFASIDWYFSIQISEARRDCRIPEFFHDRGYWICCLEHNNGDWDARQKYELFIVE